MHVGPLTPQTRATVAEALHALGKRNLVLGIMAPSYPGLPDEDPGRGTPYSRGGKAFLRFAAALGFTGVQAGPQGQTSEDNASPYDGTLFSRNFMDIPLTSLVSAEPWGGLLSARTLEAIVAKRPPGSQTRAAHRHVYRVMEGALRDAFGELCRRRDAGEARLPLDALEAFGREHAGWLTREALYEPLCREHRAGWWREWRTSDGRPHPDQRLWAPRPGEEAALTHRREALLTHHREALELHAFRQLLVHTEHTRLRALAREWGLKLFGDLQIGYAPQDVWAYQALFLEDYLMGAPPSRTNAEGQAWNYPVLDPELLAVDAVGAPGPGLRLVQARMDKMLSEFDGVRIDHPHGLVDPWVYRTGAQNALRAVQQGARLRSSPTVQEHPRLARFAIPSPAQLNADARTPRYADDWVVSLTPEQVERYAVTFDAVVAAALRHGRERSDLVCEVLSTLPYPLARVMARHGLGRFRVTQKADPHRPEDVYRTEHARPEDWVMVGNHDTKPLALLLEEWRRSPEAWRAQAEMLAERLTPEPSGRAAHAAALQADPRRMAEAKFADAFASRAENVFVFFTDLYGLKDVFNTPGTVSEQNWSLRLPPDAEAFYFRRVARGEALNLPRVLALALKARGEEAARHGALVSALEQDARALDAGT
ncbi:MAG: 4-alpha-glucanotransferase [Myxococcaceae bacterium]|nr:4-alpha-glucanotransferase [Myxococcaceae bacterium]MCI0669846.1 4-alpha-glucanotransferase [Myxococcaceae bacterium]